MKTKFLILPLFIALFSCSLNKPDFSFTNDPSKSYIYRNGDIGIDNTDSFSSFKRNSTSEDIKQTIDTGNQVLLFLYSSTCSSCERFKPIINEFENDTKLEINYINLKDGITEINNLIAAFPSGNYSSIFSSLNTPSMYLLKSALTAEELDISSTKSATDLENKIAPLINATNIYTYRSYQGFIDGLSSDTLVYFYNSNNVQSNSFYDSALNSKAKSSTKKTAFICWNKLSQIEQDNYVNLFNLSSDFEVVLSCDEHGSIINKYSYISETDLAISLINSYY